MLLHSSLIRHVYQQVQPWKHAFKLGGQTHVGIPVSHTEAGVAPLPWAKPILELFPWHPVRVCHRSSSPAEISSPGSSGTNILLWSLDPTLCGHARWGLPNTQTSMETEVSTGINAEICHLGNFNLLWPLWALGTISWSWLYDLLELN